MRRHKNTQKGAVFTRRKRRIWSTKTAGLPSANMRDYNCYCVDGDYHPVYDYDDDDVISSVLMRVCSENCSLLQDKRS